MDYRARQRACAQVFLRGAVRKRPDVLVQRRGLALIADFEDDLFRLAAARQREREALFANPGERQFQAEFFTLVGVKQFPIAY
jgi:hypothetical protein